ncbi:uncharacterized protein LOC122671495 isoform X2 [Telopea speciosissima]|uniref:uncharacterized protein LOC122671495 isoform X1 n=1 Tax=Telopea speciosissima TaxID=54955 RepID=UPI001CC4DC64|nr:uncharacterized protein LOC122671495 isoform X1 [Telopea speciosissima]XP_043724676.1 uncharacterized protein LOC122671495 isoform X2 [Telopea speciosissima]
MGTHQYRSNEREAIALSLESMYYQQNPEPETNRQHFLQQPFRHQQQHIQVQQHPYFSGLTGQEMFQTPLEEEPSLKSWAARQYSTNQALQQKMSGCISVDGAGNTVCWSNGLWGFAVSELVHEAWFSVKLCESPTEDFSHCN